MKGGDASNYAIKVFGDMNNQHAASKIDNTIASTYVSTGGKKSKKIKKGGMDPLILAPIVLVAANTLIKRRKTQKGGFEPASQSCSLQSNAFSGGKMLEELAVPVALVIANNTLKRRRKSNKGHKSKKQYRKSRSTRRRK